MDHETSLDLEHIAGSTGSSEQRGRDLLHRLRRSVPFDAAWLALADPLDGSYRLLVAVDLDETTHRYLAGPRMASDIETTQTNSLRPPLSPSDLLYPAVELATWAECLIPAGIHEALAVGLFGDDHRHIGFLALLFGSTRPPAPGTRRNLNDIRGIVARGIDPLRSLALSAGVLEDAYAGAAVCRDGSVCPLPGLAGDRLLDGGSAVVRVARRLFEDKVVTSFLWPDAGCDGEAGHVRVTVLAAPAEAPSGLLGAIVLAPAPEGDLCRLTPRELEVLGLLVDGLSNHQMARALVITPRTVATHVEHILVKLDAPTRTLAAIRAQRRGLYVPAV